MERLSSPEQLNDYIRVANPGVWLLLGAIIILLLGLMIWAVFGRLETTVSAVALVEDGKATCYVKEEDAALLSPGNAVHIGGETYTLDMVSEKGVEASLMLDAYALHLGGLEEEDWTYQATLSVPLPDGVYAVNIVTESVSPISFVTN